MNQFITYGLNLHEEHDAELIERIEALREEARQGKKKGSASVIIKQVLNTHWFPNQVITPADNNSMGDLVMDESPPPQGVATLTQRMFDDTRSLVISVLKWVDKRIDARMELEQAKLAIQQEQLELKRQELALREQQIAQLKAISENESDRGGSNGNGRKNGKKKEIAPAVDEEREDPNDPLVQRLNNMNFEF